jgi:hypothetical protein
MKKISSWILALVVFAAMFQASTVSGQTSNVYDSNLYGVNLRIQNTLVPSVMSAYYVDENGVHHFFLIMKVTASSIHYYLTGHAKIQTDSGYLNPTVIFEDDFPASLPADNPNTYSIPFTYTAEFTNCFVILTNLRVYTLSNAIQSIPNVSAEIEVN